MPPKASTPPTGSQGVPNDWLTPLEGKGATPVQTPPGRNGVPDEWLTPLEDKKPLPEKKPRVNDDAVEFDVEAYERELAKVERERQRREAERKVKDEKGARTIIVERHYTDPCGDFRVSWGGTKTCQPRKRTKYELVEVNDPPGKEPPHTPPPSPTDRDKDNGLRDDGPRGVPPADDTLKAGGTMKGASPGAPSPAPAPRTPPAAGAPGAAPGPSPVGGGSGGTMPPRHPDANGFVDTGDYAVRVDSANRLPNGDIDVLATFTTRSAARRIIGNGDWKALVTDEDGVSIDTTALYMPGSGALRPFAQMPYVSANAPAQVRFRVVTVAGMGTVNAATVMFNGARAATFAVPPMGTSGAALARPGTTEPGRLKWFEVRHDDLKTVGQTTELLFSARNHTDQLQYAGGTRLVFVGTGTDGKPVENSGRVYAARGPLGRPLEGVSVLPGQTGRFRVVFDKPGVHGPIMVKDGAMAATPALPAVAEPVW